MNKYEKKKLTNFLLKTPEVIRLFTPEIIRDSYLLLDDNKISIIVYWRMVKS